MADLSRPPVPVVRHRRRGFEACARRFRAPRQWQALSVVCLCAAASWFPAKGAGAEPPPRRPPTVTLTASFALHRSEAGKTDDTTGDLGLRPDGSICLVVRAPVRQEVLLAAGQAVFYYPDEDLALVGKVKDGAMPPMLESVMAGMLEPTRLLPDSSKMVEQKRDGEHLVTRWQVSDSAGNAAGELKASEARDGPVSIEIITKDGKPQRRFAFADRTRIGGKSVAKKIDAWFHGATGTLLREEHWTLSEVKPFAAGAPAAGKCAERTDKTKIREIAW